MKIEEFKEKYSDLRDSKICVDELCDHPNHINENIYIGKDPARKNILKHGGKSFICRNCQMKFDNPMSRPRERRQTNEAIIVYCPCSNHKGDPHRKIKKSGYYGEMQEPYLQICPSCSRQGRTISLEQREKISQKLKGIKRSEEFKAKITKYWEENPEKRERATEILLANKCTTGMLGKKHTDEAKEKQSKAMKGRKYTDEHRINISEGRKKMLKETGGFSASHRQKLREAALSQYARGFIPGDHHLSGWHESPKAGKVFFRSSYEHKAFIILDKDNAVESYKVENISIEYIDNSDDVRNYIIDLEVKYKDGSLKFIEIKPAKLILEDVINKKNAATAFAEKRGASYEIWTELELFGPVYNEKQVRSYVDKLRVKISIDKGELITDEDLETKRKLDANNRQKKYYWKHKKVMSVYCNYCKEDHEIAVNDYEKNIEKNGRYICIKENGHIQGSKPKLSLRKENPYVDQGMKQCNKCDRILPFDCFSPDNSKRDGYCTRCKECRAKINKERYQKNNASQNDTRKIS